MNRTEWYLSTVLVSGGITGALFLPSVQPTIRALFDYFIGDTYQAVYAVSEPELIKAYEFGLRVLGLVGALFVALFAVELVVRLVLLALVTLLRGAGLTKPKGAVKAPTRDDKESGSESEANSAHDPAEGPM
jgi:hypothetical protein